jgi:hypothetical protein
MVEQRLPIVDGDDGVWGDILNQYIAKEHYDNGADNAANGGHKTVTIRPGTTAAGTAPLKFTSGPLLSNPEPGAVEYLTDKLYLTQYSNQTRKVIATYDDSLGAKGDVYYRDSNSDIVRLPIGSTKQVLTVSGDLPSWSTIPAGVGDNVITVTTDSTAAGDSIILADATTGPISVTLPAASTKTNSSYRIKKIDNTKNYVTLMPNGLDKIDGNSNMVIAYANSAIDIVSNGIYWYII